MLYRFYGLAWLGIALALFPAFAGPRRPSSQVREERAIRTLISQWVEAYQSLDGKRIASLETPDVEVVDRFGEVHLPSSGQENELLWSDVLEMIAKTSARPTATIDRIRFLRPDVALVKVSWRFMEGILLVDGSRLPPYLQLDTYVVVKRQGVWLVAAHNMQERKP